ncbi:MAG: cysteine synthase family protein [Candidatus Omnitrophica bacterium]|nr:cysteine synthase family protein [Candidatus Omnitrophota bacterium]
MSILDKIGKTPLFRLKKILPKGTPASVEVYAKAEWLNPGGSVKDRPALRMIQDGEANGNMTKGKVLIDSTSGNTGIAYAWIGAAKGFPVELVMPTNVSEERKKILTAYGAKISYSDPLLGSDGARELVQSIVSKSPNKYFFPDQYSNPSNWQAHYETTGPEIWEETKGRVTHFVAGLGTSGTMMGTSRFLKEKNPKVFTLAVQPEPFHGLEGLKNMESSIPVPIYNSKQHSQKITVETEPAYELTRRLAREEGLLVGPSSGAALLGVLKLLKEIREGVIVVIFPDGGDKYLSTQLWD